MPALAAAAATSPRRLTPSLPRTAATWWWTVRRDRTRTSAISWFDRPRATRRRISSSRAVNPSGLARVVGRTPRGIYRAPAPAAGARKRRGRASSEPVEGAVGFLDVAIQTTPAGLARPHRGSRGRAMRRRPRAAGPRAAAARARRRLVGPERRRRPSPATTPARRSATAGAHARRI